MATLLMVESWLRSTGLCLPPIVNQLGHDYVLLTKDPALYTPVDGDPHPVVRDSSEVVVADTNDADAASAAARATAARRRIDGVLTTCDYYLETVAQIAHALGLPSGRPDVMRLATRKHLVRGALAAAGLSNPAFAVVGDWSEARAAARRVGIPLVAKPVDLNSGTAVERIDDEAALKDAFWSVAGMERNTRGQRLHRLLLVEERLEGQEVSVEAVTFEGHTTVIGVTDKSVTAPPGYVESGHMFPARLEPEVARQVEAFVVGALDAIGYTHGLSHTEVMITADGPRIVEINPRQAGGYIFDLVHLVTGAHPLAMLVDLALGRMPALDDAAGGAAPENRGTPGSGRTLGGDRPVDGAIPPEVGDGRRPGSAAVYFVMSPRDGLVEHVSGCEGFDSDARVQRWAIPMPATARWPRDNDAYLGHVLTVDASGEAREHAEDVVRSLRLHFTDGAVMPPLAP